MPSSRFSPFTPNLQTLKGAVVLQRLCFWKKVHAAASRGSFAVFAVMQTQPFDLTSALGFICSANSEERLQAHENRKCSLQWPTVRKPSGLFTSPHLATSPESSRVQAEAFGLQVDGGGEVGEQLKWHAASEGNFHSKPTV